jgi:hypothetical protein
MTSTFVQKRHYKFLMYVDFVEYYVSAVIGLWHFEKHKCSKKYRDYVTISNEAFAILTIENNWDRWVDMAELEAWKTSPVPTKLDSDKRQDSHCREMQ